MSKDERRELVGLVSWLQTFDQFVYVVIDGTDNDNVDERFRLTVESLRNVNIAQAVVKVAEQVCELENIDVGTNPTVDEIWTVLLAVTSSKSRFQIDLSTSKLGTEADIAHCVMATLLDFAVGNPDLNSRRMYIERIMSLPKAVQKILMSLIERRKKLLPRKPKGASSPFPKNKLTSRILCGAGGNFMPGGSGVKHALKPILKHGSKARVNKLASEAAKQQDANPGPQQQSQTQQSDPMDQQQGQMYRQHRDFASPPRERAIPPKVPQSEPRVGAYRDMLLAQSAPQSERRHSGSHIDEVGYSELSHFDNSSEILPFGSLAAGNNIQQQTQQQLFPLTMEQQPLPLPPERFASPSTGIERDQQAFASPGRVRTGGMVSPFRERAIQDQTPTSSAFSPINANEELGKPPNQQHQPHPTFATLKNEDQTMPTDATPSDEFDLVDKPCDKSGMSRAATSATADTGSEASMSSASSDADNKPPGKVITISKRQNDGFSSPSRRHSQAPQSPLKTPERALALYEQDVEGRMMLSPAESMLQSPLQVEDFVKELRVKNKNLESVLMSYQKRERELSQRMESTETKLRKEMMKLESRALGREDELRQNYENEVAKLKKELRMEKEKNEGSKKAQEDLAMANDELELMQHTQAKLQEATEKLRKYKDRLDAMNDFKEALLREQGAHSKSVEECVRLENELNLLLPLKRQLEDYKVRAIETEVQLAECKDQLARLERERDVLDGARNDVLREAQIQRAQADELRKFIKLEENGATGPGIGEGISELNPELQEEIIKLRNENVKLRAFAEKRTDDSVQKLEENLEDSNQRQERFKEEFLKKKRALEETASLLEAAREKLASLERDIKVKERQAEDYETRLTLLEGHYTECLEDLEGLQEQIELSEQQNSDLERQKSKLLADIEQQKAEYEALLTASKAKFAEFEAQLKLRTDDLENTKKELAETVEQKLQVENALSESLDRIEKLDKTLNRRVDELGAVRKKLADTETMLADSEQREEELNLHVKRLERKSMEIQEMTDLTQRELRDAKLTLKETQGCLKETEDRESHLKEECNDLKYRCEKLTKQVKEEKKAKQQLIEESHKSLEATREVLTSKANKDLEELESNMNQLLEDERKAYRQKAEQATIDYNTLQTTYEKKLGNVKEQSERALSATKEDAARQFKELEEKAKRDAAKIKQEEKEKRDQLLETGQKMIEDAKIRAQLEFTQFHDANTKLKAELTQAEVAMEELRTLFTQKNATLKKKLEFAADQINEFESMEDDLREANKKLEREMLKLEEENERFRRQLGGRYGADGQLQNQVDKLSKELMDSQKENRELKKKLANYASEDMSLSFDVPDDEGDKRGGYSMQGVNPSAIAQIRKGYEDEIANLNDEKRELIMKNSAAITDVQRAEQVAWEREQELAKMKQEMTSLKLALQRAELANSSDHTGENDELNASAFSSKSNVSFSRKHEPEQNQNREARPRLDPYIITNSIGTKEQVLTPSKKHENYHNFFSENSNPTELPMKDLKPVNKKSSPRKAERPQNSIVDVTQTTSSPDAVADGQQPECTQS